MILGQLQTLAWLEVRQMIGGAKLLAVGSLLVCLAALALGGRILVEGSEFPPEALFLLMMNFVFLQTTVILVPLLFASSLIQNEVDNGTLVYLVTRPIRRPVLLLAKFAAATLVSAALIVAGMTLFLIAFLIPGGDPTGGEFGWWGHLADFLQAGVLGAVAYGALFTLVGVVFKRGLIWGLAYGFISEFVLTNVPALIKKFTIMYYLRGIAIGGVDLERFSGLTAEQVEEARKVLDLAETGDAWVTIAAVTCVALILASAVIWNREFAAAAVQGAD